MTRPDHLSDFRGAARDLILEFGSSCTVTVPNATTDDAGTVTEDPEEYEVNCTDLVDESRRWGSQDTTQTVVGTIYLGAMGLEFDPAIGQRVAYQGRTLVVVATFPYRVQGGIAMWRLDLAEVAGA